MNTPSPAPLFEDVADGPAGGRADWIVTYDGARIRVGWWACDGAKGTVILLPGRTEYIEKYGRAATDLAARGYAMLTIDWRGQGLADRPMPDRLVGHVEHFDEYQRDLDATLAHARAVGLPEPFYMIAHSMGGCIGLRALLRGLPFKAAAFSAPMWGILMAAWMRPVALTVSTLSRFVGAGGRYTPGTGEASYVLAAPFAGNTLTTDSAMWGYMVTQGKAHPDLTLGGPSLGWLRAALVECLSLGRSASPAVPALCALGLQEKIVDAGPIHARMAAWPSGRLDLYPACEHEVMMETPTTRARFFDAACALFDANR
ncbi:alpha/beta hydrolase [Fuscibacter oryzae]|uniref:Alpha/beta hydrolase n=1 Tax=Fuscibacter oryzae TaxID=2803939 RepID=A0A8J7SUG0_9RHOB|nr:alpha/beta hydrolase [Fuscibacter oryzae]MBL4927586.1 alpha/beta hydrolase [Fuscibacter oryzae]